MVLTIDSINDNYQHMICDQICNNMAVLIILFFLASTGESKAYSKNIPIVSYRRENGWLFIDRATINPGILEIQFAIKLLA